MVKIVAGSHVASDQLPCGIKERLRGRGDHHLGAFDPAVEPAMALCRFLHDEDHRLSSPEVRLWPSPLWPRPSRAARHSTVAGVSRFEFFFFDFRGAR